MAARTRLDVALVERGLAETRAAAQRMIMAGLVFSNDRRLDKSGTSVAADMPLEVRGQPHPYVSRGGLKLEKALDHFAIPVSGRIALDVGASTGGFSDVLLRRGAAHVHAVDVGQSQLHDSLRGHPRLTSLEQQDIRTLDPALMPVRPVLAVIDVSFISLKLVLPAVASLLAPAAGLVALIKPQFEARRSALKKGVLRDAALQAQICEEIAALAGELGFSVLGTIPSPIEGGDGNREFLIGATRRQG